MKKYQFKFRQWFKKIYFQEDISPFSDEYEYLDESNHEKNPKIKKNVNSKNDNEKPNMSGIFDEILKSELKEDSKINRNKRKESSLMFKGLKIEKWRVGLLEHCTVIGIYYQGRLHFDFDIFPWYFELPIQLKYPYRKEFLLAIKSISAESS